MNAKFIKEVADCVYDDEKHCCKSLHTKGEIPDEDFNMQVIVQCTKDYFRNIHKQVLSRSDIGKAKKAQEKKDQICQWTCHQTVTKNHQLAALNWEKETGNVGAVGMIDTDFVSNILSYDEGDLSEDKLSQRVKSRAGKGANMAVGLEWCSPQSLKTPDDSKKALSEANTIATTEGTSSVTNLGIRECPSKHCRTTAGQNKKLIKETFDISSDQMNKNLPKSARKNTPFENMITNHWKKTHPDMVMLQGVEWLKGFWDEAQKDNFITEDWDYLVKLAK
ncbi:hypothetical protein BDR06DRAFT_975896 [Suillus hirtellus]|nr:hypothetical protein BDR06DRAFT_975896 [Suillus hirtellus]